MRRSTSELKKSRGFEGGKSTAAYEFPVYSKLGRGGNYGSEICPPVLADISGTSDIEVAFKLAAWMERNKTTPPYAITLDKFTLFVTVESGAGTVEGTNEFTVTNPFVWDNCSVVIKDADATTRIRIESKRPAGETTGWWRCCLDDLVIKYKQP